MVPYISANGVSRKATGAGMSTHVPDTGSFHGGVLRTCACHLIRIAIFGCIAAMILTLTAAGIPANRTSIQTLSEDPIPVSEVSSSETVTLPFIYGNDTPGFFSRQYLFPFQKKNITVLTNVSAGIYFGAKNGNKFAIVPARVETETVASDYYRAFVNDPVQEPIYADLSGQFRAIRQEHRYSDDEYLELLTVFVQSLPYDTTAAAHPDTFSRFPVETIADGTGDCDDKSVLLAGLLSREGYNVSLLLFIPEHHMAVGIECDCLQYRDTGYTYIETTGVSFLGDVPKRLNQSEKYVSAGQAPQAIPITSSPVVIKVGNGSKKFTRANETGYILAKKEVIDARIASLKVEINISARDDPSRCRTLTGTYNAYVGIHNTLGKHQFDRAGMYQYLLTLQPSSCTGGSAASSPYGSGNPASCSMDLPGDERLPSWYLPCPHGIWVSRQCMWQSVRQELAPLSC